MVRCFEARFDEYPVTTIDVLDKRPGSISYEFLNKFCCTIRVWESIQNIYKLIYGRKLYNG